MAIAQDIVTALNASAKIQTLLGSRNQRPRIPILWSSRFRQDAGIAPLEMRVNPTSVAFSQPKRIRKRNTQRGSTYFHFSDDRGRDLDILVLRIAGQTGYVSARSDITLANNGETLDKLRAWYNLYALTREPMVDTRTGATNEMECTYRSVLFPNGVIFKGHFEQALDFTEGAEAPFNKQYTMSFAVHDTEPDLDSLINDFETSLSTLVQIDEIMRDATTAVASEAVDIARGLGLPESLAGIPLLPEG